MRPRRPTPGQPQRGGDPDALRVGTDRLGVLGDVDAEDDEPLGTVLLVGRLDVGDLSLAGRAPAGAEDDPDGLALELAERHLLAVDRRHGEVLSGRAHLRRRHGRLAGDAHRGRTVGEGLPALLAPVHQPHAAGDESGSHEQDEEGAVPARADPFPETWAAPLEPAQRRTAWPLAPRARRCRRRPAWDGEPARPPLSAPAPRPRTGPRGTRPRGTPCRMRPGESGRTSRSLPSLCCSSLWGERWARPGVRRSCAGRRRRRCPRR